MRFCANGREAFFDSKEFFPLSFWVAERNPPFGGKAAGYALANLTRLTHVGSRISQEHDAAMHGIPPAIALAVQREPRPIRLEQAWALL
jgi:hypothetical protein